MIKETLINQVKIPRHPSEQCNLVGKISVKSWPLMLVVKERADPVNKVSSGVSDDGRDATIRATLAFVSFVKIFGKHGVSATALCLAVVW